MLDLSKCLFSARWYSDRCCFNQTLSNSQLELESTDVLTKILNLQWKKHRHNLKGKNESKNKFSYAKILQAPSEQVYAPNSNGNEQILSLHVVIPKN